MIAKKKTRRQIIYVLGNSCTIFKFCFWNSKFRITITNSSVVTFHTYNVNFATFHFLSQQTFSGYEWQSGITRWDFSNFHWNLTENLLYSRFVCTNEVERKSISVALKVPLSSIISNAWQSPCLLSLIYLIFW